MKKVSFGLIAMLAIIFAVSSAFTSQEQTKTFQIGWHLLISGTGALQGDFGPVLSGDPSAEPGQELCISSTETQICAAYFEFTDEEEEVPVETTFRYLQED